MKIAVRYCRRCGQYMDSSNTSCPKCKIRTISTKVSQPVYLAYGVVKNNKH